MRSRLGESLVRAGLITQDTLEAALAEHGRSGERLGAVIVRMKLATEAQIAEAIALQLGFSYVDLAEHPPDPTVVTLIPKTLSLKHECVAVSLKGNVLTVAMAEPLRLGVVRELELETGHPVAQVVAAGSQILHAIDIGFSDTVLSVTPPIARTFGEPAAESRDPGGVIPVSELLDLVLTSAVQSGASDVHIEPLETAVVIRHRLDGFLRTVMELPKSAHEGLIARLKIRAGMDVEEARLPQDGRLRLSAGDDSHVDFDVSTLRTIFGEKAVLRALDAHKRASNLEELGMSAIALGAVRRLLERSRGLILVAGPRGSGKTATLEAALKAIQSDKANIMTVEDPIEYHMPGLNQAEVDDKNGPGFAHTLGSMLRQDADVVAVGDVSDQKTAAIVVQAAGTDQLVLATLLADDAAASITGLMALGVEGKRISSVLVGVVAQRLVRRLCANCRRPYTPTADALHTLGISEEDATAMLFYESAGCDQCSHTGYRGRVGIFEVLECSETLRHLIAAQAPETAIRDAARAGGMVILAEDGVAKVKSGTTTLDEFLRAVSVIGSVRPLCLACGSAVAVDFVACPTCGARLGGHCSHCGRALQPGWRFCPYCTRSTQS
jgi:type IV pilus assembly protein PilB